MQSFEEFKRLCTIISKKKPLIAHITNYVSAEFQANCTLSIGALPVMPVDEHEIEEVVSKSDSLLINTGTPSKEKVKTITKAIVTANRIKCPIVLDPVGYGLSNFRNKIVNNILNKFPVDIIKGNGGEIASIYGITNATKGVSSTIKNHIDIARISKELANRYSCVVVATGSENIISNGEKTETIKGGSRLSRYITGMGCCIGSILASFLSIEGNIFEKTTTAIYGISVLSRNAASKSVSPIEFKKQFLNELYRIANM